MDLSKLHFRHVFGEGQKRKYESIMSSPMTLESCGIKGNPNYCAFSWKTSGGGALCILDNNNPTKLSSVPPMIVGHSGSVLDFDFHPFNDQYIATASDDTEIRLWEIPKQFNEDLTIPKVKISGHHKRVQLIQFNHTSDNIICSSSADQTIKVWDIDKYDTNYLSINIPEIATSLAWNYQGSLIGMTHKDKFMRIVDPRAGQIISQVKCHEGPKSQKFSWMGNTDYCLTTGFSKKFDRQFLLWDLKNLEKPLQVYNIDNSSGVIFPFYDSDTGLLFLAGKGLNLNSLFLNKGDGNIRFYEFCDGQFFKCLNQYSTNKSGMAYGFYSKRSVNVLKHELMRGLKLTDSTVEFISFCAPRKAEAFQDDLFPNTIGNIPAQNADDWFKGSTKSPILISMAPDLAKKNIQSKEIKTKNIQSQQQEQEQQAAPNDDEYLNKLKEKVEQARKENKALRNEQKNQTIEIDSLEKELHIESKIQQGQKNKQFIQYQEEISELEEKILTMTHALDNNQSENKEICEQVCQITKLNEAALEEISTLQNELKQIEINAEEEQQSRQLTEENDSEELKSQKELFRNLRSENQLLADQLANLQKQQEERKQNEDYQQVINLILNQQNKFVIELNTFLSERKQAIATLKQNM